MSLFFEFKDQNSPRSAESIAVDTVRVSLHSRDNVNVTPTGSWATALVADSPGPVETMIVFNNGAAAVRISQSDETTPLKFHIVPAGSQRALSYIPGSILKVRTL